MTSQAVQINVLRAIMLLAGHAGGLISNAQNCTLQHPVHMGSALADVTALPDGSALVVGRFTNGEIIGGQEMQGQGGYYALRSPIGTWIWVKIIGGADAIANGAVDQAGNLFISGSGGDVLTFADTVITAAGDLFVAKLDPNGDVLWVLRASNASDPIDLESDGAGGVFLAGNNYPGSGWIQFGAFTFPVLLGPVCDVYLARASAEGSWEWVNYVYGPPEANVYDMTVDSLGRPIIVGAYTGYQLIVADDTLNANTSWFYLDTRTLFVACAAADGEVQWTATADSAAPGWSHAMKLLADPGRPLRVFGNADGGTIPFGYDMVNGGNYIAELDYNGQGLSLTELPGPGFVWDAVELPSGHLLVSGGASTPGYFGGDLIDLGSATQVGFIGICDMSGNWYHADQTHGTGTVSLSVELLPGQEHALCYGIFTAELWVGTDTLEATFGGGVLLNIEMLPLNVPLMSSRAMQVWPNPARSTITLDLSEGSPDTEVRLTDAFGRTVLRTNYLGGPSTIDLSTLASGPYVIQCAGLMTWIIKE